MTCFKAWSRSGANLGHYRANHASISFFEKLFANLMRCDSLIESQKGQLLPCLGHLLDTSVPCSTTTVTIVELTFVKEVCEQRVNNQFPILSSCVACCVSQFGCVRGLIPLHEFHSKRFLTECGISIFSFFATGCLCQNQSLSTIRYHHQI